MTGADWIGTIGVSLLLIGFGLNLLKLIGANSWAYLILNLTGAALAGVASAMIGYIPFIILEGVWTLVSLFAIIQRINNRKQDAMGA